MKRFALSLLAFSLITLAMAQDTTVVSALNYSTSTRDTVVSFPDGTETYRKIIMRYSMRCKGARVSTGSNRNLGCGEWDYSCNTYIEDPTRIDSLPGTTKDYTISNFTGTTYNYTNTPMYTYYRNTRKTVTINNTSNTSEGKVGSGSLSGAYIIPTSTNAESGYAGKSQFMYTAAELLAAGITAGDIHAISLEASASVINNLQIRVLSTTTDSFNLASIAMGGFTSVFYDSVMLSNGENTLYFHTPYAWDGTSNLILEFSTNGEVPTLTNVTCHLVDTARSMVAYGGKKLLFDGTSTYVESNTYPGVLGNNDRTIDVWIKTNKTNGEICSWGRNAAGEKWVFRVNGDGTLRTEVNGGGVNGTTNIADNQWHHVACVFSGNSVSDIKHYVDGVLDANSSVGDRSVNTTSSVNVRISKGINNRYFGGEIDEIRIWTAALSATEIAAVKNRLVYPQDSRIALHYKFDVENNDVVYGSANTAQTGTIYGDFAYTTRRAIDIFRGYYIAPVRPNITFKQGTYDISISESVNFDKVLLPSNTVRKIEVVSNANMPEDDIFVVVENSEKWNSDLREYYYDEAGMLYDSASVTSDGSITPTDVPYMRRWPSRLEIMSFVTPYGIGLDLGPNGKTWTFDVTDFGPVLQGNKRMFLSRGGQNQEEMDIEFLFIKGTPPRNVLDIRQIWPSQQITANYTQIQNNVYYAPIDFSYDESAKGLKLRSGITGHGQDGEFIPRDHTYTVNSENYTRTVWKECASNPVYPQGGTWIYDRAGWCPGMATDVAEYDLTEHLNNDNKINIDYNVNAGSGDSRYIISSQVVTYGDYNFNVDAEIIDIKEPSNKVEYARENPMCISPRMLVKNTGKDLLTSIEIDYWVNDKANKRTFTWPCHLRSDEVEEIYFPIDNGIWSTAQSTNNQFFAELVNVNGAPDEYTANNNFVSGFDLPEVYPQHIYFFYRTNSFATENTISVKDEWGTVLYERNNLTANTLYRDTLFLGLGCKTLEITDNDGDGISFWANNDGSGFFRIMEVGGSQLKNIEPDFGNGTKINFTVAHTLDVPKLSKGPSYKLYPNPTTGIFTLSGGDLADSYVRVYNAMGQQIESMTTLNAADLSFDLSSEPAGVYFVSVAKNGSTWTQKVIIR